MFEDLVGKKVRIVKKDTYSKIGILLQIKDGFLKIEHDRDGNIEYIEEAAVSSIVELGDLDGRE